MISMMLDRCTARALDRWRENAKTLRRLFAVARKVVGRMLHRWGKRKRGRDVEDLRKES